MLFRSSRRQALLKLVAAAVIVLFLLDRVVFGPATKSWTDQSQRVAALREQVQRGRQLLQRETTIRGRWASMVRVNLPGEVSAAESGAFTAVSRWASQSQITLTSLAKQWQNHEDGFQKMEFRVAATGSQAALGNFIHALETDPMPVKLEECEFATRDPRGAQLAMTARFTFLRMADTTGGSR